MPARQLYQKRNIGNRVLQASERKIFQFFLPFIFYSCFHELTVQKTATGASEIQPWEVWSGGSFK